MRNKTKVVTNIERRNITHEFRVSAEGEQPTISGYAALFDTPSDNMGGWVEQVDPHAFDSVLKSNPDVRALWNHNPDCVLGRTVSNTLRLTLDSRGLAYVIDAPDTQLAKDLMVSMRRKDVTQSSFGFICKRDQWTENSDGSVTRRILEFDSLLDVSPVTYPAYSGTTSQVRSLPHTMPTELRSKLTEQRDDSTSEDETDTCDCECGQCLSGAHGICSAETQCGFYTPIEEDEDDDIEMNSKNLSESEVRKMEMRLALIAINK